MPARPDRADSRALAVRELGIAKAGIAGQSLQYQVAGLKRRSRKSRGFAGPPPVPSQRSARFEARRPRRRARRRSGFESCFLAQSSSMKDDV